MVQVDRDPDAFAVKDIGHSIDDLAQVAEIHVGDSRKRRFPVRVEWVSEPVRLWINLPKLFEQIRQCIER